MVGIIMTHLLDRKTQRGALNALKFGVCAVIMFATQEVYATPTFVKGALNELSFNTYQNLVDVDKNGAPTPGDIFYGILNVTRIASGGTTRWDANNVPGPGIDSFSGYYAASITSFVALPSPWAGAVTLGPASFDPNGIFSAADLAAGTMVKLFTDSGTPFESNGSVADDITKATDGPFWASFGFPGGYWNVTVMNSGQILGLGGLNLAANSSGLNLINIVDPGCSTCAPVQQYFNTVAKDTGANKTWRYIGANNANIHPAPEPAATWLMGIGMMGLYFTRRKMTR